MNKKLDWTWHNFRYYPGIWLEDRGKEQNPQSG